MKTKIKSIKKIGFVLDIDGEYYEPVTERTTKDGEVVFRKINKKRYKTVVKSIVDRLANYLNKKQILRDAICELPFAELEKIEAMLESKGVKPKIKQKLGCIELEIGESTIQIR